MKLRFRVSLTSAANNFRPRAGAAPLKRMLARANLFFVKYFRPRAGAAPLKR